MKSVIIRTAGHIDHGKTVLVTSRDSPVVALASAVLAARARVDPMIALRNE